MATQAWSEAEKARAHLRVAGQLRAQTGQTLDVVANCQAVADALVPGFADVAVEEVVDSVIRGEDPLLAPLGSEVPLRRAGFRYGGGEAQIQAHPLGDVRKLPFPGPYARVLTDLQPRVIIKDLTISCEVHDGSPVMPYLRHPGTLDEFGRGLLIVGRLVEAWGTRRTPDGKIVWAEVALPQRPESR